MSWEERVTLGQRARMGWGRGMYIHAHLLGPSLSLGMGREGDVYRTTIQRESCYDRGCGRSGWPIAQSWGAGVKEGFPEEVMSTPRPEGYMGVRGMVRERAKKGNSRPRGQHVQRLRGRTPHSRAVPCVWRQSGGKRWLGPDGDRPALQNGNELEAILCAVRMCLR